MKTQLFIFCFGLVACLGGATSTSPRPSIRGSSKTLQANRKLKGANCDACWPGTSGPCKAWTGVCYGYQAGEACPPGTEECAGEFCKNTVDFEGQDEGCSKEKPICVDIKNFEVKGHNVPGDACAHCINSHLYNNPHVDEGCSKEKHTCVSDDGREPAIGYAGTKCVGTKDTPDCSSCWPGTSGPCKAASGVCYNFLVNDMCPPGTEKCAGEAPTKDKNVKSTNVQVAQEPTEKSGPPPPPPKADEIKYPTTIALEDAGPIPFGADIAAMGHNMLTDETEFIAKIKVQMPSDTPKITYAMSGTYVPSKKETIVGHGSAQVSFDFKEDTRSYTITSNLLDGPTESITQDWRKKAEEDILSTIKTFSVSIGPLHNDKIGNMVVTVTNVEVKNGLTDSRDTTFSPIVIKAIAQAPGISVTSKTRVGTEDDGHDIPLHIVALPSEDTDGSETLSVKISVPSDKAGPIGSVSMVSASQGVNLKDNEDGTYLVTGTMDNLIKAVDSKLAFKPRPNFSGTFKEKKGIRVDVRSTEGAVGDRVEIKTSTATAFIDVEIKPVLDVTVVDIKGNAGTFTVFEFHISGRFSSTVT